LAEPVLESLKRHLDAEEQSEKPVQLPDDFYLKVATYAQLLMRTSNSASSELTNRLIAKQMQLLSSMLRNLVERRMSKAVSQGGMATLLPEERYICSVESGYVRHLRAFIDAISSGQPSAVERARENELSRSTTVRILKHVDELVGLDLSNYGPFEPEDLALIPAANADLLIASGEAVEVVPRARP
jgi:DNA replication initiation complex subunit (GINS family)